MTAASDLEHVAGLAATWNEIIEMVRSGQIKPFHGFECDHCYNSGFRQVDDPQGSPFRGVVRCDKCRYWEFHRQRLRATA